MPNDRDEIIAEDAFNRRLSGVRKARPTNEANPKLLGKNKPQKPNIEQMLAGGKDQLAKTMPIIKEQDENKSQAPLAPDVQAQLMALAQMPGQRAKQAPSKPAPSPSPSPSPAPSPVQDRSQNRVRNQDPDPRINFQHPLDAPQNPLRPDDPGKPELLGQDSNNEKLTMGSAHQIFKQSQEQTPEQIAPAPQEAPQPQPQAQLQPQPIPQPKPQQQSQPQPQSQPQEGQLEQFIYDDLIPSIFNFRYAMKQYAKEIKRATRHQRPLSVSIISFPELEEVRSRYGEMAGSSAFLILGNLLTKHIDLDMEIIGRYGDQIFIVLPEFAAPNAAQVLDELRRSIESTPIQYQQHMFNLNASIGIAGFPNHGTTWKELLVKAEQASNTAAERGGNTIAFPPRQ